MTALDTNILIYSCDKSDPRRQQTALEIVSSSSDGVLLWQVACEFVAASRKLAVDGFTTDQAWERLAEYLEVFPLVLPSAAVLERAGILHRREGWSFGDAMIVAACVKAGVTHLYSEDLPGRAAPAPLQVINPFATGDL